MLRQLCGALRRGGCLLGVIGAAFALPALAGPIDPPPGPVAPTMKRLDQIEPRTCVNTLPGSPTAVHVISAPGNYVLTADVRGQEGKHGILVDCPGDVVLDLNGFSLLGVPGSLDGLHVTRDPADPDTRRSFALPHVLETQGRIVAWGGDGLHVFGMDSCTVGGLDISDCGGVACRVSSHELAKSIIQNIRARSCAGGGVVVDATSPAAPGGAGGSGKVVFQDLHFDACGGDGMHIRCLSSSTCEMSVERCSASVCSGHGLVVDATFGGGGGGGKVSVQDLSITRCTGDGVRCVCRPDWRGPISAARVEVTDVDGDGIACFDVAVNFEDIFCSACGGAGIHVEGTLAPVSFCRSDKSSPKLSSACAKGVHLKNVTLCDLSGVSASSCTEEGLLFEDCGQVTLGGCDVLQCGGSGIVARNVVRFKAGAELASKVNRVAACGGHGVEAEDCDDIALHGLDVGLCTGDGARFTWTQVSGPYKFSTQGASITLCGGAGIRVECPAVSVSLDATVNQCSLSSNSGPGLALSCPAPSSLTLACDGSSCVSNGAAGVDIRCHPDSSVQCACSHLRCVGNGGGGIVLVSSDAAAPLASGLLDLNACTLSANDGAGVHSHCPVHARACSFCENSLSGVRVSRPSPFDSAGSMHSCTLSRNGLDGLRCDRGKYANCDCVVDDNGGNGMECADGCLVVTSCSVNHNALDGVRVSGTLTVEGGSFRRNGSAGIRCSDGQCVASRCVCELNGGGGGAGGGGAVFLRCSSVSLDACVCSDNVGHGIRCSSDDGTACRWSSTGCVCSGNTGNGMDLDSSSAGQVVRCICAGNGQLGIACQQGFTGGRVEGCSCTGNAGGLHVSGQGNLVVSNSCSNGPAGAFSVAMPGNTAGRILDAGSLLAGDCDPRGNVIH